MTNFPRRAAERTALPQWAPAFRGLRYGLTIAVIHLASPWALAAACPFPAAQQARQLSVLKQQEVAALVDERMSTLREYVLNPARGEGQFPAYRRWLRGVAATIRMNGSLPRGTDAGDGDAELAPFRKPIPMSRDLQKMAAIKQKSHLTNVGPWLVETFRGQPRAVRDEAANHLLASYNL